MMSEAANTNGDFGPITRDDLVRAIEAAAERGAAKAIAAQTRERKEQRKVELDRRHNNTKLLLRNYRRLNDYLAHAVFDADAAADADEDFAELMRNLNYPIDDELFAESIQREHARTAVIMTHVNRMLDLYKYSCLHSGKDADVRKWRALHNMYVADNPLSAEDLATSEFVDKRTVYKDRDAAIKDMACYLFGVAALDA